MRYTFGSVSKDTSRQTTAASQVTYSGSAGVDTSGGLAEGVIELESTVSVTVTNGEKGGSVEIPFTKTLKDPDGKEHSYTFLLEQVTEQSGETLTEPAFSREQTVTIQQEDVQAVFSIDYPQTSVEALPAVYYYRITEKTDEAEPGTVFDSTRYVVKVTVDKNSAEELEAAGTAVWKNGIPQALETGITFENTILCYELPQTGGTGTSLYTLGGLCMMAGAFLLYFRRKGE